MIENYANNNGLVNQEQINHSIINQGFSESTILLIDNLTSDILNGKSNLTKFNQKEHAGLCCAGEVLIGAYIVCNYARTSLTTSGDAFESKRNAPNWEIDELQEKLVQEWAELNLIALLTDALVNNATKKQCEVLFNKLLAMKEEDIAKKLGISQPTVNSHSSSAKWYCIEEALKYFEQIKFEDYE